MKRLTFLGLKHTEESKSKISASNKGKPKSDEHRRKLSEANKGKVSYWKGKTFSEETILKIKEARKRQIFTLETRRKMREAHLGIKSPFWRHGKDMENKSERELFMSSFEYRLWRKSIFERDTYTCVLCGDKRGNNLEADHIKKYIDYPELRLSIDNGRTLCKKCHINTPNYGNRRSKNKISEHDSDQKDI